MNCSIPEPKIRFLRLAHFALKPSSTDAPRRELQYALYDASKHATGDDVEAIYTKHWFSCGSLTISIEKHGLTCGSLAPGCLWVQFLYTQMVLTPWIKLAALDHFAFCIRKQMVPTPWLHSDTLAQASVGGKPAGQPSARQAGRWLAGWHAGR